MAKTFITLPLSRDDADRVVRALKVYAKASVTEGRSAEATLANHLADTISTELRETK